MTHPFRKYLTFLTIFPDTKKLNIHEQDELSLYTPSHKHEDENIGLQILESQDNGVNWTNKRNYKKDYSAHT